nr:CRE-PIG-1 protein [Haemonchus contortus]
MKLMDGKYLENKRIKPVMHLRLNWRWLSCRIWERWKISGKQKDKAGHALTVELEVVVVQNMGKIGIRRKRLCGDAFLYKKVWEQILRMAALDAD